MRKSRLGDHCRSLTRYQDLGTPPTAGCGHQYSRILPSRHTTLQDRRTLSWILLCQVYWKEVIKSSIRRTWQAAMTSRKSWGIMRCRDNPPAERGRCPSNHVCCPPPMYFIFTPTFVFSKSVIICSTSFDLGISIGTQPSLRTSLVPNANVIVSPSAISTAMRGSRIMLHSGLDSTHNAKENLQAAVLKLDLSRQNAVASERSEKCPRN